jgi:microcystin-dependent protein
MRLLKGPDQSVQNAMPIGSVIEWFSATAPTGWMICYLQSLSITTYSDLYAVIGTTHGKTEDANGNITHFNAPPDGVFYRSFYPNSSRDPDRASRIALSPGGNSGDTVGAYQADAIKAHNHGFKLRRTDTDGGGFVPNNNFPNSFKKNTTGSDQSAGGLMTDRDPNSLSHTTENTVGSETRPPNINVYKIIKFQ